MRAPQRREEIVRMARTNGLASVEQLAEVFGVTQSTIRRDLSTLDKSNQLARTYGGVIAVRSAHYEASLQERAAESHGAKDAIGRWAAGQVEPGQTVLLDAGTTTARVAAHLHGMAPLTVVTSGLTPFFELADDSGMERILLGGEYREVSQSFVGPLTEAALDRWSFDRAFLGADAVTAERGICEASPAQTRLKELMARASDRVYVLAHSAKLGATPFNAWVHLPGKWTLVTDSGATAQQLAPFDRRGIATVVAD
ncbi:DeoR/GlpR family DNA-binding transcription regulator [Promicromonospora panici]|uniref:DeoR/GlpR family DNA-binding transcription regulator n=1 Tax=Promicromonospora panici TaxID=2219658 RepID=UPI00101BB6CD|nr:DeoR/GlpR family DNA-binding transcription regulator [Promicromonospora panici]